MSLLKENPDGDMREPEMRCSRHRLRRTRRAPQRDGRPPAANTQGILWMGSTMQMDVRRAERAQDDTQETVGTEGCKTVGRVIAIRDEEYNAILLNLVGQEKDCRY
uniref:LSM domain-containing protein n=1 Tax=Mycena chlorophos TaxID=658473 RepID=A0ABQ0LBY9_MYCCL|nr:predicted protein [Mycena chlorophos]